MYGLELMSLLQVTSAAYTWAPPLGKMTNLKDLDVAVETGINNGVLRYSEPLN